MAFGFIKKTWKDRISEYPTRRTLTKEDGSTELVTVSRSEGTVSQEGDAYCADNMNDLEKRVDDALNEANSNLSSVEVTLGSTINSTVTVNYPSGFTRDNCVVIGAMVSYDNAMWQFINNGTAYFDVSLQGSNIQFIVRGSAFLNATAKIMLMKI